MKSSYSLENEFLSLPGFGGIWIVDKTKLSREEIHQLCDAKPGRLILLRDPTGLRFIPHLFDDYARIAGMISDAV